jgi:hypothetical protein
MNDLTTMVGFLAGFATTAANLPQVWKTSADLSRYIPPGDCCKSVACRGPGEEDKTPHFGVYVSEGVADWGGDSASSPCSLSSGGIVPECLPHQ